MRKTEVLPLNWQKDIKEQFDVDIHLIDNDFALLDNANILPAFYYLLKSHLNNLLSNKEAHFVKQFSELIETQ